MSFDWSKYLDVARELAEQAKNAPPALQEARYRASISRAYFAVFGKARDYLRNNGVKEPGSLIDSQGNKLTIHRYVEEAFRSSSDRDRREIGLVLDRLRRNRQQADYADDIVLKNLSFTTQVTLKWAKDALDTLDTLQKK